MSDPIAVFDLASAEKIRDVVSDILSRPDELNNFGEQLPIHETPDRTILNAQFNISEDEAERGTYVQVLGPQETAPPLPNNPSDEEQRLFDEWEARFFDNPVVIVGRPDNSKPELSYGIVLETTLKGEYGQVLIKGVTVGWIEEFSAGVTKFKPTEDGLVAKRGDGPITLIASTDSSQDKAIAVVSIGGDAASSGGYFVIEANETIEGGNAVFINGTVFKVTNGGLVRHETIDNDSDPPPDRTILHYQPNFVLDTMKYGAHLIGDVYVIDNQSAFLEFTYP